MGLIGVALFLVTFFRGVKRAIHVVNLRPDAVGLWPLAFLSTALLVSISESGITYTEQGWLMFVVAILAVSNYTKNQHLFVDPSLVLEQELDGPIDLTGPVGSDLAADTNLVGSNVR